MEIDLNGFLQLKAVRAGIGREDTGSGDSSEEGYTHGLSMNRRVKSDADESALEIGEVTKKASPCIKLD